MIKAIEYGFEKCQDIVAFQEEAMAKFGKEKKGYKQKKDGKSSILHCILIDLYHKIMIS